jgi:hypothetical protein
MAKPKPKKPRPPEAVTLALIDELRQKIDDITGTLVEIERTSSMLQRHVERERVRQSKRRARSGCRC